MDYNNFIYFYGELINRYAPKKYFEDCSYAELGIYSIFFDMFLSLEKRMEDQNESE